MQIISFDNCKGVARAKPSHATVDAMTITRSVPYVITMDSLKTLKSDIEKECPYGFYLRAVDLLARPSLDPESPQPPHLKITKVKCSDLAMDYPDSLDQAWGQLLEQAKRIKELETQVSEG